MRGGIVARIALDRKATLPIGPTAITPKALASGVQWRFCLVRSPP